MIATVEQVSHELGNAFKASLAARHKLFGHWNSLSSNLLTEISGEVGFDWLLIDTEHAPYDLKTLISQLQALKGTATHAVARPLLNDPTPIRQLLDIGFRNFLIPYVQNADEARLAVMATRYSPEGVRGVSGYHRNNRYGGDQKYFQTINQNISVIAQIESLEAVSRIEEIGAVPGIDALFVGPGDLAASMGYLGQVAHSDVQEEICRIGSKAVAANLSLGIAAANPQDLARYLSWGYHFATIGSDSGLFRSASLSLVDSLNALR